MMKTTLGGISVARPPPAQMQPSARFLSYLRPSIAGSATTPIVTISAPITPTIAAISAQEMTTATASPPGSRPDQTCTARKIDSATPARSRMHAMKMNSGTDTST